MKLGELVGGDLANFKIVKMTEVYRTNMDGVRDRVIGYFKEPHIADVFAGSHGGKANLTETREVLVLTDGQIAFLIPDSAEINIFNDEMEVVRIKEWALSKLTPAERKLLGY